MRLEKFYIYSFYRFTKIKNTGVVKLKLDNYLNKKLFKGTILLANEGINGSVSSSKKELDYLMKFIRKTLNIKKLNIKVNESLFLPFKRIKVRLKKEIVTLGVSKSDLNELGGKKVDPIEWKKLLTEKKSVIIDTRNKYEISIGSFKDSINPNTNSFREFPKKFKELKISKNSQIGMFCTGGIRCEKASAYLKAQGYKNVFQLDGGILNYFDNLKHTNKEEHWHGECFVFDDRVTVNKNLEKGTFLQCYGCRMPIKNKDTKSDKYIKGVSCPHCYDLRSKEQKKRSLIRQTQIDNANKNKKKHPFKKITIHELL